VAGKTFDLLADNVYVPHNVVFQHMKNHSLDSTAGFGGN
jgi:hypothetical protein